MPKGPIRAAFSKTSDSGRSSDDLEREHHLPGSDPLATGLARPMFRWASGGPLDLVLEDADLAAGDFVRWSKQTIDLLDQLSIVADGPVGRTARDARSTACSRRGGVQQRAVSRFAYDAEHEAAAAPVGGCSPGGRLWSSMLDAAFPDKGVWPLAFAGIALVLVVSIGRRIGSAVLVGFVAGASFYFTQIQWAALFLGPLPMSALSVPRPCSSPRVPSRSRWRTAGCPGHGQ